MLINTVDNEYLDWFSLSDKVCKMLVFGKVVNGIDILEYINNSIETDKENKPVSPIKIEDISITKN